MAQSPEDAVPFVRSVLHPTDFSEASRNAFAHALAMALVRQTELTILHVVPEDEAVDVWTDFPPVRSTLERWGLLPAGSPRSAVADALGVAVKKVNVRSHDVFASIADYLDRFPTDLIVLSSETREILPQWMRLSTAERVARRSHTLTLFVPDVTKGIVSYETGEIHLRRVLVPVDHSPDPEMAVGYAARVARLSAEKAIDAMILHVGGDAEMPEPELPEDAPCRWEKRCRGGDVVDEISKAAGEYSADLIIMATHGHHGILDGLRGNVTEQVLRRALCPVLAVPAP